MVEYELCSNWSCVIQWLKDFQQLATGMLAIIAAVIALLAAVISTRMRERYRRRAAAAAFWAELVQCKKQLLWDADMIKNGSVANPARPPIRPPRTEIFDANPAAVGLLSSEEAFVVTRVYKWLQELRDRYASLTELDYPHQRYFDLASSSHIVIEAISDALSKLQKTAGVTHEQAAWIERVNLG